MTIEKLSLSNAGFYAPRFEVEIKGKKLAAEMSKAVIDVKVEENVNQAAGFTLTIHDGFDINTGKFKWLDHPLFREGHEVTVRMGYSAKLSPLLVGKITRIESNFFQGETTTVTIGGEDLSSDLMNRATPERSFKNMKYSDIVKMIAGEVGLNAVVDSTGKYKEVFRKNNNESYQVFIERMRKEMGYEYRIDGRTLYFIKPGDEKREVIVLELGKDIIRFNPRIDTGGLVSEVEVRVHNPLDPSKPIVGRARAGSERGQEPGKKTASQVAKENYQASKLVVSDRGISTKEQADAMARSRLEQISGKMIEGDGECIGIPGIRAGVCMILEKLGERFSGKYYVKGTTHSIDDNGYRTRFNVKRNAI